MALIPHAHGKNSHMILITYINKIMLQSCQHRLFPKSSHRMMDYSLPHYVIMLTTHHVASYEAHVSHLGNLSQV
jgi:hypothetical protein